jgi:hypothetical protein
MIRHVALFRLRGGVDPDMVVAFVEAIRKVHVDGLRRLEVGPDLGLRDGNCDLAVVCDLDDRDAYLRFDSDQEHVRVRKELAAPIAETIERIQFEITA